MLNVFLYLNKEEKWKQTTGQDEDENMKIIETYGNYIEKWSNENPGRARWLLKTGWKAQNLKFRFAPDKRLMPAEQYLARLMMDTMIRPLERPEESAIVSIFTPCEILQEAGLHPYNVEGFSCYLSASKAERAFLQQAENTGISETLCSYHKTFIGAAQKKVLPKPKCIVYTNLTCDANLLTFKKLAKMYDVPIFAIDVPMQQNEDNVQYVADQLRKLEDFIEECTGKKITDPTSGMRMVGRDVIGFYAKNYPKDYPEPESVVTILKNGKKVEELPVQMNAREEGVSSISPRKSVYYMIKVSLAILIAAFRR